MKTHDTNNLNDDVFVSFGHIINDAIQWSDRLGYKKSTAEMQTHTHTRINIAWARENSDHLPDAASY